jgi:group II intron reverse transcriptase/maturase
MQETFDWLYERSIKYSTKGINLLKIITSENNILLAYRTIKSNTGSKTAGVDNKTINDFKIQNKERFIKDIRHALKNYRPHSVRRVNIYKENGKIRPLGIPTMLDRLIQQMFKQVLEPICEAQFHKHSYGFRPNRSTEHALSRCNHIAHSARCHHVVDIDIKGFFDNVHHGKLINQLYSIGIKDRRVLAIISKMLKAPIQGEGIPSKGVPQGGILSTLLSNVVLNDLDWWVSNQWETFQTKHQYSAPNNKFQAIRKTNLKQMHMVRYCDDFKIFTTNHKDAVKIFHAVKGYIEHRLNLEISPEKSRITNLRRRYSEFLGFEIKVVKQKKQKYVTISKVSKKAKSRIKRQIREKIKAIQRHPHRTTVIRFNQYITGVRNYYQIATKVSMDFSEIYYSCLPVLYNRLRNFSKYEIPRSPPPLYQEIYGHRKEKAINIQGIYLFPLDGIKWRTLTFFNPAINNYTEEGRSARLKQLKPSVYTELVKFGSFGDNNTLEYLDNRISRYSMQNGKCAVTGIFLRAKDSHCHHVIPRSAGGTDKFDNLVVVHKWIHYLIHATSEKTIAEYLQLLQLTEKQLKRLNTYRRKCNLTDIR